MTKLTTDKKATPSPDGKLPDLRSSLDVAAEVHCALSILSALDSPKVIFNECDAKAFDIRQGWDSFQKDVSGFHAWPVFLGLRYGTVEGAMYNRTALEQSFPDYFPEGIPSQIRSAIGEAVRNIGQHGHRYQRGYPGYPHDVAVFAPGCVFAQEIHTQDLVGQFHRMLIVMVSDEGQGVAKPQESILHGVGDMFGRDHLGMGHELEGTLLYLVKSRVENSGGEWLLFDGLHTKQVVPEHSRSDGWGRSAVGPLIEPLHAVDLPKPPLGCQKIMFFGYPDGNSEATFEEVRKAISQLAK